MAHDELMDPEEKLDEAIEETFPASDAPANTIETGIRLSISAGDDGEAKVQNNAAARRFEIAIDGQISFLQYERRRNAIVLVHTEVPPPLRRRGLAGKLAKAALEAARAEGLQVVVLCPFVRAYLEKHPELGPAVGVTG
jgi:hypothetical protein